MEDNPILVMELMVRSLPDNRSDDFGFFVSKSFANKLLIHVNMQILTPLLNGKTRPESGDEFTYRGIKCKVA